VSYRHASPVRRTRKICVALVLLSIVSLPVVTSLHAGATTAVTLAAAADATVDRNYPTTNYGTATELLATKSPERRGYLRFDIPSVDAGIQSAVLSFYVPSAATGGADVFLTGSSWSEGTLTFNNAPALGTKVATVRKASASWVSVDVTTAAASGQALSVAIRTASKSGSWKVSSRESSSGAKLEITPKAPAVTEPVPTTSPEPTTSPTPAATTSPTPTATASPTPTATPTTSTSTSGGTTYYLDPALGSDTNNGTSAATPWKTLWKAESFTFAPGSQLLLRRDATWTGSLKIAESGTSSSPIVVGAYGTGALPKITGASSCLTLDGAYIQVNSVELSGCTWAGVSIGGANDSIERSVMTLNVTGAFVRSTATDTKVLNNQIVDNNKMSVLTQGGDDDSGAFGVLLQGDRAEVAYNNISGHDAFSYDYGRDGAAVEVYGARYSNVHHNVSVDNHTFTELGNPRSTDNVFAYNLVRSALANSTFVITRGAGSSWGPILRTRLYNNTVVMTGSGTQGFICHDGCGPDILTMRNNVIRAVWKAGYADAAFDGNYNLYWLGQRQFPLGSSDIVADPRFISESDLRLAVGSPGIDSGTSTSYSTDLNGTAIDARPDRGAYEHTG
jgi:hypothetical protein